MDNFSKNMRRIRKTAGMTQEELAQKLGLRQMTISRYERGGGNPGPETVCRIAEALNVSTADLLEATAAEADIAQFVAKEFSNPPDLFRGTNKINHFLYWLDLMGYELKIVPKTNN